MFTFDIVAVNAKWNCRYWHHQLERLRCGFILLSLRLEPDGKPFVSVRAQPKSFGSSVWTPDTNAFNGLTAVSLKIIFPMKTTSIRVKSVHGIQDIDVSSLVTASIPHCGEGTVDVGTQNTLTYSVRGLCTQPNAHPSLGPVQRLKIKTPLENEKTIHCKMNIHEIS